MKALLRNQILLLGLAVLLPAAGFCQEGGDASGGGTYEAFEFSYIATRIVDGLKNSSGNLLSPEETKRLGDAVHNTKVYMTDKDLTLNDRPVECVNHPGDLPSIECNISVWRGLSNKRKIAIAVHEFAGIARLEKDQYGVSTKIVAALEAKLDEFAEDASEWAPFGASTACYKASSGDVQTSLLEDARYLRIDCVKKEVVEIKRVPGVFSLDAKDGEGNTALNLVADFGVQDIAKSLGRNNEFVQALKQRALEIATVLIDNGANLESRDKYENTPILRAAYAFPEMVILLTSRGADITATANGETVLHNTYDPRVVELYIKAGGNLNQLSKVGEWNESILFVWTMWAADLESVTLVQGQNDQPVDLSEFKTAIARLVRAGADINAGKPSPLWRVRYIARSEGIPIESFQMYGFLKSLGAVEIGLDEEK